MIWQVIQEKTSNIALEMCQKCLKCHCLNQKKVNKKDSDLKKKEKENNKLLPKRFGNCFRNKTSTCATNLPKRPKVLLFEPKKVKQKDSEYKNSSLVGPIDCKSTNEMSKLLVKCFIISFRRNRPISARNVPKLPEMSLFEPRKKSKRRIAISNKLSSRSN